MKLYIAGPISGKSAYEVFEYFVERKKILRSWGYTVFNPMIAKEHLRAEKTFKAKDYKHPISTNRAIIGRDRWMVGQADVVFMDLTGGRKLEIDAGRICEVNPDQRRL